MDFSSNDFIVTYGIPEKLLSDRIKEFKNGFFFRNTIQFTDK